MKPQKARGNQRQSGGQSEAIRGHQLLVIQRPTETIRCNQAAPQTKSDAIRRNQAQSGSNQAQSDAIRESACPEHCVSVFSCFGRAARACVLCFCVLSRHNGPVFCVFVFWQTPLKTQGGGKLFNIISITCSTEIISINRVCWD